MVSYPGETFSMHSRCIPSHNDIIMTFQLLCPAARRQAETAMYPAIRNAVAKLDASLPVYELKTMTNLIRLAMEPASAPSVHEWLQKPSQWCVVFKIFSFRQVEFCLKSP